MEKQFKSNDKQNNFSLSEIHKIHPILYLILIFTFILIILLFLYLIEKTIFLLLTIITYTKLISLPLLIFLHLLLIRYLILQVAFSGQNLIVSRSILNSLGRNQANPVCENLKYFHDLLSNLSNKGGLVISIKELSEIKRQIGIVKTANNYIIDIYNKMKNKFNQITIDQKIFYENILSLNNYINNGNLLNFLNNTIDIIKKNGKQSSFDLLDEEKNKISSELSVNNSNIQNILLICHNLMEQIIDYLGDNYHCFHLRFIRNYFQNKIFASIEQLHCELNNYYFLEEKTLITSDNCKLEYIILRKNLESPRKKLIIICGPNGVPFQIFSRNFRFENYLEKNMDVLCWNYRGYGFSKGKPSYSKLRSDILELFDEVKRTYNYEKFAVHGISIGGIPCCHLSSNRQEIELMICDRNFGRLDNMVQSFPYGKYLFYLYRLFLFESTENVDNYLNVKCYKIILNDPKDTIVLDTCSLKTLISAKLCEKYLECYHEDNNNSFNNSIVGTFSYNELESLSSKKDLKKNQNTPLTSLNDKISSNDNNKNSKILIKKTALDKIFNSVEEKNKFVNLLINFSNIIKKDKFEVNSNGNILKNFINQFKNKNSAYTNLKEEELQHINNIFDFLKNNMKDIFDSIESSGDTFFTLFILKRDYTKAVFIDNFFNNMFIWGSKYYKESGQFNLHSTKNIKKIFEDSMKLFEEFMNSQEIISNKELILIKDIENVYKYFIQIQNSLKYVGLNTKEGFVKLINEDLIDENDYEQCLIKINIGYFIPLNCGHNGALSSEEAELFEKYLSKSSFLNDKMESNV